jgi:hypothetical protein
MGRSIFQSHTVESDLIYLTFGSVHTLKIRWPEKWTPEPSGEAAACIYVPDEIRPTTLFDLDAQGHFIDQICSQ